MKYLKPTYILLKQISKNWSDYYKNNNLNDLKQTLKYFEQNSSFYLTNTLQTSKQQQQNKNLIKKSPKQQQQQLSSNDLQQMQNINSLVKVSIFFFFC
jgi:hypothetical protein